MPGLSIAQLRRGIRKATGIEEDDPDLIDDDIDLYLNRALWELDNKFPFREKEKTVTFDTIIGTRNYDVPKPADAVKTLAIMDNTSSKFKTLRFMETFEYDNNYTATTDAYDKPWGYTREGCLIRLWPTPDAVYTIALKRLITISDITDTDPDADIPIVWHEILGFGGLWRAFIEIGDLSRANQVKNHQIALINSTVAVKSKEIGTDKYAGVEVLRATYDQTEWWNQRDA